MTYGRPHGNNSSTDRKRQPGRCHTDRKPTSNPQRGCQVLRRSNRRLPTRFTRTGLQHARRVLGGLSRSGSRDHWHRSHTTSVRRRMYFTDHLANTNHRRIDLLGSRSSWCRRRTSQARRFVPPPRLSHASKHGYTATFVDACDPLRNTPLPTAAHNREATRRRAKAAGGCT